MGNDVQMEIQGEVRLVGEVTRKEIRSLFSGSLGSWSYQKGVFYYSFWNEGSRGELSGPNHGGMLDRLVELGYNSAAWREEYSGSSENGGAYSNSQLRGNPEQKRKLRLQEIDQQLVLLSRERQELLSS